MSEVRYLALSLREPLRRDWRGWLRALTLGFVLSIAWGPVQGGESVLQPGPGKGKDIWTTSVFCYCTGGGGPGGGLDDDKLVVGGWADLYYALLEFDLSQMPEKASSARLELFAFPQRGNGTTGMYLDRITEFWDWRTQGTGADFERLWWADRPAATQWLAGPLAAPTVGEWYSIDITDLYNAWQDGTHPNYGVQLRPVSNNNRWNEFYSSDFLDDSTLRPKLVVEVEFAIGPLTFPLKDMICEDLHPCTAYTAEIISVIDHAGTNLDRIPENRKGWYSPSWDNVVRAFNREEGHRNFGVNDEEQPGYKKNLDSDIFVITGSYTGDLASGSTYLNYDGHPGYDYRCVENVDEILAAADGVLRQPQDPEDDPINGDPGKFNSIMIEHGDGFQTWYLHAKFGTLTVPPDTDVVAGQAIAKCGKEGTGGPQLHFEVRKGLNQIIDPYLEAIWAVGPALRLSGSCPGPVELRFSGATPNGKVALGWSSEPGSFEIPTGGCAGTLVHLASPGLVGSLNLDDSGEAALQTNAPAGACGIYLQALDVATCSPSNVWVIQ